MKRYGYVESGVIKNGPTGIPASWKNISGFNLLSDAELIKHGWFVWEFVEIAVDPKTEILENNSIKIVGSKIVESQVKRAKTDAEKKDDLENLKRVLSRGLQAKLDNFAKTRGYDTILSATTYTSSNIPKFKAEGQYCADARDLSWSRLDEIISEIELGKRPIPDQFSEIESDLPSLVWPV